MMLNDPCDHRYVLYALGEGPGNLWEASGLPPQPPGVIAGGVRLVSFSAVVIKVMVSPFNYRECVKLTLAGGVKVGPNKESLI